LAATCALAGGFEAAEVIPGSGIVIDAVRNGSPRVVIAGTTTAAGSFGLVDGAPASNESVHAVAAGGSTIGQDIDAAVALSRGDRGRRSTSS